MVTRLRLEQLFTDQNITHIEFLTCIGEQRIYQGRQGDRHVLIQHKKTELKDQKPLLWINEDTPINPKVIIPFSPPHFIQIYLLPEKVSLFKPFIRQAINLDSTLQSACGFIQKSIQAIQYTYTQKALESASFSNLLISQNTRIIIYQQGQNSNKKPKRLDDTAFAYLFAELAPQIYQTVLPYFLKLFSCKNLEQVKALIDSLHQKQLFSFRALLQKTTENHIYKSQINSLFVTNLNVENPFLSKKSVESFVKTPTDFLKKGESTTVYQAKKENITYVIKRYNVKNTRHFLRRCYRPSRAWHSWKSAKLLEHLNIAVLQPIAAVENRFLGMRKTSYFISNHINAVNILDKFDLYIQNSNRPSDLETTALIRLFNALYNNKISHGDLKGTNILWYDNEWVLIDLDAVKQHQSIASFQKAYLKDRNRFLKNWQRAPDLYQYLDSIIFKINT